MTHVNTARAMDGNAGNELASGAGPPTGSATAGRVVTSEFRPEFHCGDWPDMITTGSPVGSPVRDSPQRYVKGSGPDLAGDFHTLAVLPPGARDTGFRLGKRQLW